MNKFNQFFTMHGVKIIIILLLLSYFKSCSIDSEVERIKKEQRILTTKCALTLCGRIIAQVDCVKIIMQGTNGCIDLQFFGEDNKPLDLTKFTEIQIMLYNEFDCTIANFWWPSIPTGCKGLLMTILQYTDAKGVIHNKGMIRICLDPACTKTSPTGIFAEILLTELTTAGTAETSGIPCLQVAKIIPSRIYENGCDDGCS